MFLPIGDDAPRLRGTPVVTWVLIAVNVGIAFNLGLNLDQESATTWGFVPSNPSLMTAFTCMFLHANIPHLLGNMWFLYIFGDNVELQLGKIPFLLCYLIAGFGGTAGHYLFFSASTMPTVGASGAIYGVMGMYLYLFPFNKVRFLYFIIILIGTVEVSAFWAIGYFFMTEAILSYLSTQFQLETGVGHLAHAGGFAVGLTSVYILAKAGVVEVDGWTFGDWLKGKRRNRQATYVEPIQMGRPGLQPIGPSERRTLRGPGGADYLTSLIQAGHIGEASQLWREAAAHDPKLVLGPREQLLLGQTFDEAGLKSEAADAYERLIRFHPDEQPYAAEAHLSYSGMLLEAARAGGRYDALPKIRTHLREVLDTHPNASRRELAAQWLAAVESAM